jgi:hypothetical protein
VKIEKRIEKYEFAICSILAQLSYHMHLSIVERIKTRNTKEAE